METLLSYLLLFLPAYAILFMGASSPGPAVALVMGVGLGQGRGAALLTCLGIALGSASLNVVTMAGVGVLVEQAAWAMTLLRILGAAYLLYLAFGAFKKAINPPTISASAERRQPPLALFAKGYLLQATNPKAVSFWLAIAALDVTRGAPFAVIALFVLSMALISFLCHAAWAVLLSASSVRSAYQRCRRYVESALGAFLTFAAFKLATTRI